MRSDRDRQGDDEGLAFDEQQAPSKPRPAIDPLDEGGAVTNPISPMVADLPQTPGRVDAGEAVTGTRAGVGGEAPADERPGDDASLEADRLPH